MPASSTPELVDRLRRLERAEVAEEAELRRIVRERAEARERAEDARIAARLAADAKAVLLGLAAAKQAEVGARVEGLVTRALRAVFRRRDYRFRFLWEEKRGVAAATPLLTTVHGGEEVETELVDGHGGGVVDVVAFVLRFVVARHSRPPLARLIVADEPFRHVAAEHADGLGELLASLAGQGWQFLIVTHQRALAERADRAYRVRLGEDGRSIVERVGTEESAPGEASGEGDMVVRCLECGAEGAKSPGPFGGLSLCAECKAKREAGKAPEKKVPKRKRVVEDGR